MIPEDQLTPDEIDWVFAMYPMANILVFNNETDPKGLDPKEGFLQGVDFINHKVLCDQRSYNQNEVKLVLNQLNHISDHHIYGACYAYENIPFCATQPQEWKINREIDVIQVWHKSKKHSYVIDQCNGNVNAFIYGRKSTLGKQAAVVQYLIRRQFAMPLYIQPKHSANGKTPHQLGLATPNFAALKNVLGVIYEKDDSKIKEWFFLKRLEEVQLNKVSVYNMQLESLCLEYKLDMNKFL